ncbi:MAG: MFS transporter [Pseudomonadota bacterium]
MDNKTVDVTRLIDDKPISRFQLGVFLLCAMVVFLDGIDYQIIGLAAPLLIGELGIARSSLGLVFSAGTLGAAIGALSCGLIADRFGRKRVLIATTMLFGLATVATASATGLSSLALVRFVTGLGLGGAVPCLVALTSEYAPKARRATIVSLLWAAFPLGATIGGFVNAYLIHQHGWRTLFYVWGLAPVLAGVVLIVCLPESVRFLLARGARQQAVAAIVARITGQRSEGSTFVTTDEHLAGMPIKHLFKDGRAMGTLPLWAAMFVVLGSLMVITAWTPTLITPHGFTPADAAMIIGINSMGSFIGTCSAGWLIERIGVARCVIPAFIGSAIGVIFFGNAVASFEGLAMCSFAVGICLGISSSSGIALSVLVYPTAVRSSGIGLAMAMGRFGAVFAPLAVGLMVSRNASVGDVFFAVSMALLLAVPCIWLLAVYSKRRALLAPQEAPTVALVAGHESAV